MFGGNDRIWRVCVVEESGRLDKECDVKYPAVWQGIVVIKVCYLSEFSCDSKRAMSSAIFASLSAFSETSLAIVEFCFAILFW